MCAVPRYRNRGVWGQKPDSDAEDANEQLRVAVAEIMTYSSAYVEWHSDDTATGHFTHRVVESVFASQQSAPTSGDAGQPAPITTGTVDEPWEWQPKHRVLNNNGSKETRREFNYC